MCLKIQSERKFPSTVKSAGVTALGFLTLALICHLIFSGIDKLNQGDFSGPVSAKKAVVTAHNGSIKGNPDISSYDVKFSGPRGYLSTRRIYVAKQSCGKERLERGQEIALELQRYEGRTQVRKASTLEGCILYGDAVRAEMKASAAYMKYILPVGMLLFVSIAIFDLVNALLKSCKSKRSC